MKPLLSGEHGGPDGNPDHMEREVLGGTGCETVQPDPPVQNNFLNVVFAFDVTEIGPDPAVHVENVAVHELSGF